MTIDFKKKLASRKIEPKTNPIELYETLDRKSVAREFDSSIIKKTFAGRINPVLFLSNFSFLYMLFYVIV